MRLHGNSAIVTGGAGGLGEATVRQPGCRGRKVVISDFSEDKGAKLLADELGGARSLRPTDVTRRTTCSPLSRSLGQLGPSGSP